MTPLRVLYLKKFDALRQKCLFKYVFYGCQVSSRSDKPSKVILNEHASTFQSTCIFFSNIALESSKNQLESFRRLRFNGSHVFFTPVITVYSSKSSKTVLFRPFLSFYGVLFFPRNQSGDAIINNDTSA